MKRKNFLSFILGLFGVATVRASDRPPRTDSLAMKRAFNEGWIAYAIDSLAISFYHDAANRLTDDDDKNALAAIWETAKKQAAESERQWEVLTPERQAAYPCNPFWKSNRGEPRRVSRSQQKNFIEATNR